MVKLLAALRAALQALEKGLCFQAHPAGCGRAVAPHPPGLSTVSRPGRARGFSQGRARPRQRLRSSQHGISEVIAHHFCHVLETSRVVQPTVRRTGLQMHVQEEEGDRWGPCCWSVTWFLWHSETGRAKPYAIRACTRVEGRGERKLGMQSPERRECSWPFGGRLVR